MLLVLMLIVVSPLLTISNKQDDKVDAWRSRLAFRRPSVAKPSVNKAGPSVMRADKDFAAEAESVEEEEPYETTETRDSPSQTTQAPDSQVDVESPTFWNDTYLTKTTNTTDLQACVAECKFAGGFVDGLHGLAGFHGFGGGASGGGLGGGGGGGLPPPPPPSQAGRLPSKPAKPQQQGPPEPLIDPSLSIATEEQEVKGEEGEDADEADDSFGITPKTYNLKNAAMWNQSHYIQSRTVGDFEGCLLACATAGIQCNILYWDPQPAADNCKLGFDPTLIDAASCSLPAAPVPLTEVIDVAVDAAVAFSDSRLQQTKGRGSSSASRNRPNSAAPSLKAKKVKTKPKPATGLAASSNEAKPALEARADKNVVEPQKIIAGEAKDKAGGELIPNKAYKLGVAPMWEERFLIQANTTTDFDACISLCIDVQQCNVVYWDYAAVFNCQLGFDQLFSETSTCTAYAREDIDINVEAAISFCFGL